MKNNYFFKNLIIPLLLFMGLLSYDLHAQTIDTFDTGTGATFTAPAGVTSVQVEIWGGGGAGGGGNNSNNENGGGASGAYAVRTYDVTTFKTFTYTVGGPRAGGAGAGSAGNASSTTWSGGGGFATMTANGGNGGSSGNAANGGTATSHVNGDTGSSNGVAGDAGVNNSRGGKGGNAPGSGGTGGLAQSTGDTAGNAGNPAGGGGGGSRGNATGGAGAAGRVRFTYTVPLPPEINILGNLLTIANGAVSPTTADHRDFGTGASLTRTFTIQNTTAGSANLTIGAISFTGTNAADFAVTTDPSATVAGSASTTFIVTFTQGGVGARTATVNIPNNDSDEAAYTFDIVATGIAAVPEIDVRGNAVSIVSGDLTPDVADFTNFDTLNTRDFDIYNTGVVDLNVASVIISGPDAASFSVETNPDAVITSGSSSYFSIAFAPTTTGVKTAVITVNSNDSDEAAYTFTIQGTGIDREINIIGNNVSIVSGDVTPDTADHTSYDTVYLASTWVRTFRISNTGTMALTLNATPVTVAGSGSARYTILQPSATIIAGNSYLDFDVTYAPTSAVTDTATITVASNDSNEASYTFAIDGTGLLGSASALPGCLGDSTPVCNNSSNSSFTGGLTGWTATNFSDAGGSVEYNEGDVCTCTNASLSQALTGLTSSSSTLLVKFKLKLQVQSCNTTGRALDFNVTFNGVTYLTARLQDDQTDAFFVLQNGGILVATDASTIRTNFTPGGCSGDGGPDQFATIFLSVPKAIGATTGTLAFTISNPAETTSQIGQLHLFLDDIEATADTASCGFLWLKSNAGVTSAVEGAAISTWNDQSINGNHATQTTAGNRPSYNENALNFNPGILFDGTNDVLSGASGYASGTQFIVFKPATAITNATTSRTLIGANVTADASDVSGFKLGAFSTNLTNEVYGVIRGTAAAGLAAGVSSTVVASISLGTIVTSQANAAAPPTGWVVTRNGIADTNITGGSGYAEWAGKAYALGASPDIAGTAWSQFYGGHILEVITYPAKLSANDLQKITSYLGIKYGLTLASTQNYLRGNGSTTYNTGSFSTRIFGIGREDCQGLHQRQSRTESSSTERLFTIGYNSIIGTTNSSTTGNDMPNDTYFIMGENGGSRAAWAAAGITALTEATRISRQWKATSTGTPSSAIRFQVDGALLPAPIGSAERIAMVVSTTTSITSATFTGADIIIPMTLSGANWICDYVFPANATRNITLIKYNDCYSDLVCVGGSTTWTTATGWSNGTPTVNLQAIITDAYDTAVNGNFSCCKLTVNNTLTIHDGGLVQTQSNIVNNGSIVIANNGALMQYADAATNSGAGSISVTRVSHEMWPGDYTYWSSPVAGFNISGIPKNRAYYRDPTITTESPWVEYDAGVMASGKGYIVMTDNASKLTNPTTSVTFTGTINNGRVTQTINRNATNTFNLLGNPYPSGIDAADFLADNPNLNGAVYFWTHHSRINEYSTVSTGLRGRFSQNDYAIWTAAGATGTAPPSSGTPEYYYPDWPALTNPVLLSNGGNTGAPSGKIGCGQGFFVEALTDGTTVTFKNCQRTEIGGTSNWFYKSAESDVKDRFWLDITNEGGAYKQILLGYFKDATLGLDRLYDAKVHGGGDAKVSIYTITNDTNGVEQKLSIQGRPMPFNSNDEIPLGFRSSEGSLRKNKIEVSKNEGIFEKSDIYLEDKLTKTIHNLKNGAYEFESDLGEYTDRFVIKYQDKPSKSATNFSEDTTVVAVVSDNSKITIQSKSQFKIESVAVYDVLGKTLYTTNDVKAKAFDITTITPRQSVLIVVTTLTNGEKVTSKIIF